MKNINTCLVLILSIFIAFMYNSKVVDAATLVKRETGYTFERIYGNGTHHASDNFYEYEIDGETSYCIEPLVHEGTNNYGELTWEELDLPNEIKERMLLVGYYGYTYPNHQTLEFRAATQALIWEAIMGDGSWVTFNTKLWSEGTPFEYGREREIINDLIAHHYDKPSFNGKSYKVQVGETVTLTDTNNILSNFDVTVIGAKYTLNGNTIKITPEKEGVIDITLTKRMAYESRYKFFGGNEIQNMLVPGTVDPMISRVRINAYFSDIELEKEDDETVSSQGQATLKNAVYGVYEQSTGKLITTIKTDEYGRGKTPKMLSYKEYYLQEIEAPEGYKLDKTRYNVDMRGKETETVTVFESVIKNYVSILKQYGNINGETDFLNAEKDIIFEIFHPNGNKYDEIITDKNGYATINLPYGTWKFHQKNTTNGFEKIYDFYVTVDEDIEEPQYYNILNNSISAYLQVIKVDSETGKTIALANTTFKILNRDTNQYVSQFVGGKVYSEFKTDKTGKFTTLLKLPAGNYKLEEITNPNGYVIDKNGLNFTIGEETIYQYTTNGLVVSMYYYNTPIHGKIEIHKVGEILEIKDGKYTYKTESLKGIEYNVYAREDIKSADGNHLYFNKGDLVDTIETDEKGYASSKILPLGKYYVVETKTIDGYILDRTEYDIELTEVDNETELVYNSIDLTNYLEKGELEFTKTDLVTGEAIPDTVIEIYTITDELIFTGKTDKDGKISIKDLKLGKYYIIEKESATGYVLTTEKVFFEILENNKVVKAEMKNKPVTGGLEFTKTDFSTGTPLPNTLIEIYTLDDELVFIGRTDEHGKIIIEELKYGKYYILEKEAPEGYILNEEKMFFEIKEDGEIIKANMANEKAEIDVPITGITEYHITEIIGCLLILTGIGVIAYVKKKRK